MKCESKFYQHSKILSLHCQSKLLMVLKHIVCFNVNLCHVELITGRGEHTRYKLISQDLFLMRFRHTKMSILDKATKMSMLMRSSLVSRVYYFFRVLSRDLQAPRFNYQFLLLVVCNWSKIASRLTGRRNQLFGCPYNKVKSSTQNFTRQLPRSKTWTWKFIRLKSFYLS